MAAQDLGSAYARFTLSLADLETKAKEAEAILTRLENRVKNPIQATINTNVQQPQQNQNTGPQQLGFNFNRARSYGNSPSNNTVSPGAANAVAGALAGNQQVVASNDKLVNSAIRAAEGEGRLSAAIKLTQAALTAQGLSAERINALRARLGILTARQAAEEDQLAAKEIKNAAAVGNFADAFTRLSALRQAAGKDAERLAQADALQISVTNQARKSQFDLADAAIMRAKAEGRVADAIKLSATAEAQALATGDKKRAATLAQGQAQLRQGVIKQDDAEADNLIRKAAAANKFGEAYRLLGDAQTLAFGNAQRLLQVDKLRAAVDSDANAAMFARKDGLITQAKAVGNLTEALRLNIEAQREATATGNVKRVETLKTDQTKIEKAATAQKQGRADDAITAAVGNQEYAKALALVAKELGVVGISQDRRNALVQRGNAINRTQIQALNDEAIAEAKLATSVGDTVAAVSILTRRKLELMKAGLDSIQVEKALADALNQDRSKQEGIADAEIRRLTIQKELAAALTKTRQQIAIAPAGPAGDTRRADLSVTEANLIALQAQAQAKLAASTSNLQRQQKLYGDAIDTLTAQQKNYTKGTTAWNILEAQKIAITKQATGEAYKDADAEIRAAKAARDWQLAQKLLNDEMAKAASAGDTRRIANLSAQISQVNRSAAASGIWASFKQGIASIAAPLAAGQIAIKVFQVTVDTLKQSLDISAEMDLNGRALGAFFGNVGRGTRTLNDAEAFASKYKLTFNDVGEAAQSAGLLLRNSFVSTGQTLEVLARLQQRAPNKNFQDAVRSVVELQSGQLQSLERVFNIPQKYAQQLAQDLKAGEDPIIALDRLLNKLGNTEDTLLERTKGLAGAQNNLSSAWSEFKKDLGDLLAGPATGILNWLARAAKGAADLAAGIKGIPKVIVNPQDQLKAGEKFFDLEKNQIKNGGIVGKVAAFTVPGIAINAFKAFSAQGTEANARVDAAFRRTIKTIGEMRDDLVKTNPVLAQFLPKNDQRRVAYEAQQAQASVKGPDSIDEIIDKLNTVNSQYDEGTKNAYELAAATAEITKNVKATPDTLQFIAQLKKDFPNAKDQLEQLQILRGTLQRAAGNPATDQEKVQIVADYSAVTQAIAKIEGEGPITIDVKFRVAIDEQISQAGQNILDATKKLETDRESIYAEHSQKIKDLEGSIYTAGEAYRKNIARSTRDFEQGQTRSARDFGQQRLQAEKDFAESAAEQEYDFQQQKSRAIRDFGQQQLRSARDFAQQQARSERDFAQQRMRSLRDFNQSEARSEEDRAFQAGRTTRDRANEDLRSERDHLRDMQNARRDFDIANSRSAEDYNDQRIKLLAEGRIKEAQQLAKQFGRDQGRRNEDFVRNRSDSVDSYGQTKADRDQARKQQDDDAKVDFERARARRQADFVQQQADAAADHAQQRKDTQEAFAQQNEDAKTAFAQQQKDADEAHALQTQRAAKHFQEQQDLAEANFIQQTADAKAAHDQQQKDQSDDFVAQIAAINQNITDENAAYTKKYADLTTKYNEYIATQKTAFEEFVKEQVRIRELEAQHMDTDEATAIAKMEATARQLEKLGIEQSGITQETGYKTGMAWVKGLAKALEDFAKTGVDPTLDELNKKIAGHSPPPQGPLRNIDKGAYAIGRAWSLAFKAGIGSDYESALENYDGVQRRLVAHSRTMRDSNRTIMHWDSAGSGSGKAMTLTVPVAISLDGKVVGSVVAPHVATAFMDDLTIAVSVVDASQNIAHTQTGFRGNPSSTRS